MKRVALIVVPFLLLVPAARAVTPTDGCYHGHMNGVPSHEGDGDFRLRTNANGQKILPSGTGNCEVTWSKILAPSTFECNQLNAQLEVNKIAVVDGVFDYSGNAPIGPNQDMRHIRFKGHWVTPTKAKGFTRIGGGGCDSEKDYWTFKQPV